MVLNAKRNPINSIRADIWKVSEVKAKLKPKQGQSVSVVCEGNFPIGMIANDLFDFNGQLNRDFEVKERTTLSEICNQQEDAMRIKNPSIFK